MSVALPLSIFFGVKRQEEFQKAERRRGFKAMDTAARRIWVFKS